ncbi:unnamed protein product [Dovyalis caffra]|uniref:Ulp1-like peptidase n=1 Tax=Dovyalis caffra TaxID=77055 RepID=A0AAV1QQW5_9ROSI|nr:unnamed protein product [Dovyalis caffra]
MAKRLRVNSIVDNSSSLQDSSLGEVVILEYHDSGLNEDSDLVEKETKSYAGFGGDGSKVDDVVENQDLVASGDVNDETQGFDRYSTNKFLIKTRERIREEQLQQVYKIRGWEIIDWSSGGLLCDVLSIYMNGQIHLLKYWDMLDTFVCVQDLSDYKSLVDWNQPPIYEKVIDVVFDDLKHKGEEDEEKVNEANSMGTKSTQNFNEKVGDDTRCVGAENEDDVATINYLIEGGA